VLPEEERDYTKYLDREFLKAYADVDCRSGEPQRRPTRSRVLVVVALALLWK
jgi:hypothetical protein